MPQHESVEEAYERILRWHPIEFEERIPTLSKPLIIETAYPGWQPRYWGPSHLYPVKPPGYVEGGIRFPAVPQTIDEHVTTLIASIKAGASAVHVHPRDPNDPYGFAVKDDDLLAEVYSRVFAEVDAVPLNETFSKILGRRDAYLPDYVQGTKALLEKGNGNQFCQGAVMLWPPNNAYPPGYRQAAQDGVRFMEANDVKPIHKLRSSYSVREMKRALIDTGVMTKTPHVLVHDMGHPFGWPMDMHPWWGTNLISALHETKERIPESVIGVFPGGRNWLSVTLLAIVMGADIVRAGIEDCYWENAHSDDVIQSNVACIEKVVSVCKALGRPVATTAQTREILGLKLVKKAVAV